MYSAVHFNHQNRGLDRLPSVSKKEFLRKKYKIFLLSSFEKIEPMETSRSSLADRIEQVKKTKIELELIKILYFFLDGHGNFTSNLVTFKIESF